MKNRIWIASELFYPVQTSTGYIMTEIAKELSKDYDVHVVCGPAEYAKDSEGQQDGLNQRITVHRINLFGLNKDQLVTRTLRILLLSLSITTRLLVKAKRGEKVFIVTNPAFLVLLVTLIGRVKKFDIRILVHDVFPENLVAAGLIGDQNGVFRFLQAFFGKAYRSAQRILVLGRDMEQLFLRKGVAARRISVTENWADLEAVVPQFKTPIADKIVIQFAGNMGRVQGLLEFARAYKDAACKHVVVDMVGNGAVREALIAYKQTWNLELLNIRPSFARGEQSKVLNECDIALVCLAKGMFGLGVPSKVYNVLAAGKPILYVGDPASEVALMIREFDLGWQFDDFNAALIDFLKHLDQEQPKDLLREKAGNARKTAERFYDKQTILSKYKRAILQ